MPSDDSSQFELTNGALTGLPPMHRTAFLVAPARRALPACSGIAARSAGPAGRRSGREVRTKRSQWSRAALHTAAKPLPTHRQQRQQRQHQLHCFHEKAAVQKEDEREERAIANGQQPQEAQRAATVKSKDAHAAGEHCVHAGKGKRCWSQETAHPGGAGTQGARRTVEEARTQAKPNNCVKNVGCRSQQLAPLAAAIKWAMGAAR